MHLRGICSALTRAFDFRQSDECRLEYGTQPVKMLGTKRRLISLV